MPLPKRRHSKSRGAKRRGAQHLTVPNLSICPNCKAPKLAHRVCPVCGFYKGRQVLVIEEEKKEKQ